MTPLALSCAKFEDQTREYGERFTDWLTRAEESESENEILTLTALILAVRDDILPSEANERVTDMAEQVACGADPEDVLHDDAGLEPDYIFDLLG